MKKYLPLIVLCSFIYSNRDCLQETKRDEFERSTRPVRDTFAISPSGHFYIHYDILGNAAPDLTDLDENNVPDYIDEVGIYADSARHVLIDILGYTSEPSDGIEGGGSGNYDIYITSYSPGAYGYCQHEGAGVSFVKIDNDYLGYNSNYNQTPHKIMNITVVHEYFHAVQWGYRFSLGENAYFYEMSSTWFEDVIIPDGNDYLEDGWVNHLLNNPTAQIDNMSGGYELALFGHYLSSYLDSKGTANVFNSTIIREIWERFGDITSNAFTAIGDILENNYNISYIETWIDFISRNLYNGAYPNLDNSFYYYADQALIDPIYSSPIIMNDSIRFELYLDNKSADIKSYQTGDISSIVTINHYQNDFIGKVGIISIINQDNNNLFWSSDTIISEVYLDVTIHFVYGYTGNSDITVPIDLILSAVPLSPYELIGAAAQDSIILHWNSLQAADDNINYIIYRDGDPLDITSETNFIDSKGIEGFTDYTYEVTCVNEYGESQPSNTITILSWPVKNNVIKNQIISLYPNPIHKTNDAYILFALGSDYSNNSLELINIWGQIINTVPLQSHQQGWHRENINSIVSSGVAAGIYFIRLRLDNVISSTQKISILP